MGPQFNPSDHDVRRNKKIGKWIRFYNIYLVIIISAVITVVIFSIIQK